MSQWEDYIEKYLDRAITVLKTYNSTDIDLKVFEELRETDVPAFFNSTRTKVRKALEEGPKASTVPTTTSTETITTTPPIVEVKL